MTRILIVEDEVHLAQGLLFNLEAGDWDDTLLKQLSRRTSLSVSLLSQIERAESSASIGSLYRIAGALDVELARFFGDF